MNKLKYLKSEVDTIKIDNQFIKAEIKGNIDDIFEIAIAISNIINKIEIRKSLAPIINK